MQQAVKKALAETISTEASGKKVDQAVIEYVGEAALFQLHIKTTLMAIKIIDEPSQWNPRVGIETLVIANACMFWIISEDFIPTHEG